MKTDYKSIVEQQNKKAYRWPSGWDTREVAAAQLECPVDRVAQLLAPAIREGILEVQAFPVWDDLLKRVVRVTGYRKRPAKEAPVPMDPSGEIAIAIRRIGARHPGAAPAVVQKNLPKRFRGAVSLDDIRRILS